MSSFSRYRTPGLLDFASCHQTTSGIAQKKRSSTKRIAKGRPASAPASPSVNCIGVQRLSAAFVASR